MRLDTIKIDERIKKLQEIQRIAADPEMLRILFEFIDTDEESASHRPAATPVARTEDELKRDFAPPDEDEVAAIINGIMREVAAPAKKRL